MERYHGLELVIFAVVHEMERAKGGVAILLSDVFHSAVIDFGCVSSRNSLDLIQVF